MVPEVPGSCGAVAWQGSGRFPEFREGSGKFQRRCQARFRKVLGSCGAACRLRFRRFQGSCGAVARQGSGRFRRVPEGLLGKVPEGSGKLRCSCVTRIRKVPEGSGRFELPGANVGQGFARFSEVAAQLAGPGSGGSQTWFALHAAKKMRAESFRSVALAVGDTTLAYLTVIVKFNKNSCGFGSFS